MIEPNLKSDPREMFELFKKLAALPGLPWIQNFSMATTEFCEHFTLEDLQGIVAYNRGRGNGRHITFRSIIGGRDSIASGFEDLEQWKKEKQVKARVAAQRGDPNRAQALERTGRTAELPLAKPVSEIVAPIIKRGPEELKAWMAELKAKEGL